MKTCMADKKENTGHINIIINVHRHIFVSNMKCLRVNGEVAMDINVTNVNIYYQLYYY